MIVLKLWLTFRIQNNLIYFFYQYIWWSSGFFLGIHFTLSEELPSYSVFYLIVFTVLCLTLVSFLNYMKIVIIVILKLYIITLAVVTMMC